MDLNKGIIQQLKERQEAERSKVLIPLNLQLFARKIKIALSDGHGYLTAGKRTPDGYNENRFNEKVVQFLHEELIRCGFDVLLVAPTTADTPLKARTDAANNWGADAYIAIHYNALGSTWRSGEGGIETYHYPNSASGKAIATAVHNEVIKGTPLRNRGVKSANLHEVRESNMPAALLELGFMDIQREADLMKSEAYQRECAQEVAIGLCKYFNVAYVPAISTPTPSPVDGEIGVFTVGVSQLNVRQAPDLNAKIVQVIKQGEAYKVWGVSGHWYNVGNGWVSNSGGKYGTFTPAPPKPTPPSPTAPTAPSGDVYRVIVDGKQVGAYSNDSNIVAQAKKAIEGGAKNIELQKV